MIYVKEIRRVLVCGGRAYADRAKVFSTLQTLHDETGFVTLIHGDAPGADTLAAAWARHGFKSRERFTMGTISYPADWNTHGRAAGPIRNQQMIDECKPDLVVAFPGGRGTADMVRRARAADIPVQVVE